MKNYGILCCLILLSSLLLSSCGNSDNEIKNAEPEVVATSTMIADMVRTIAGPDVKVIGLMAPGVDPHTYEPPARVYSDLRHANAIIYNGLHLEGKMTEAFEKQGDKAIAISDHLPADRLISPEAIDAEFGDPHVWGDASLWALAIPFVVEKLASLKPEKKADFEARGKAYQKEVEDFHAWAQQQIASLPESGRVLITSHDAFNYFGKAYGLEVYGLAGISTVDEPSGATVLHTIDMIKEKGVKAIFPESSVNPSVIERISKDAGVSKGETLFSDSCGQLGDIRTKNGETYDVGTYIGMMKHNVNSIVDALK
ncbi:MAG: zinc ABC transporter substrate-binding protein [Verrucomicrobiales bacterium]|nr:zinc ABC transporter substrate-binding protein [Verrucomicrobiales bacterium]